MTGTHYTLGRDRPKEKEPAEKACRECGVVKATTDANFGTKWHGTREKADMWHVDVCKKCMGAKVAAAHARRRESAAVMAAQQQLDLINKARQMRGLPPLDALPA